MPTRVEATMVGPARAGWLRIVLAPGAGLADGGIHIDVESRLVPDALRMPNTPLWVDIDEQSSIVGVYARSPGATPAMETRANLNSAELLNRALEFAPPTGWVQVDLADGVAYAPAGELERAAGNLEFVATSMAIQVIRVSGEQTPEVAAKALMRRRVPNFDLPTLRAEVDGKAAFGFDWTDGVRDIFSFFVPRTERVLVEFSASASAIPAVEPSAESLIQGLLSAVRWRS